jgi:putative Ca2+/H+ antiporter (TMEM165/GDT1 family)
LPKSATRRSCSRSSSPRDFAGRCLATVALAAQYHAFSAVVAGTTLGMMIANVPAVLLADRIAHRMPIRLVHGVAAAIFAALGIAALAGIGRE